MANEMDSILDEHYKKGIEVGRREAWGVFFKYCPEYCGEFDSPIGERWCMKLNNYCTEKTCPLMAVKGDK